MPPKGAKVSFGRLKSAEDERDEPLQAVIIADSFETRFRPFTLERPRCLLPLANTPLIEYTLEFLANSGVQEVLLYAGAHTDQVEKYINNSRWRSLASPFRKFTMLKTNASSVGDVMRDLDSKHIITGDFICVSGDVVSNYPIQTALAKHRARRRRKTTDGTEAIMTMVLRQAGTNDRVQEHLASPVFVLDPATSRCVHYEEMRLGQNPAYLNLDPILLKDHKEIDIREDLIDCHIDICTPGVLSLWSDSFDYQSPRKHFLYGVLKDFELNSKTIHTHIIKKHYAARVHSLNSYDAITHDIVARFTFPLCPDTNLVPDQAYIHKKGVYQEQELELSRSCTIGRYTVIGSKTIIGDGSKISRSVIGRRCTIGKNVVIDGAYVWDDTVIGDGSRITQAIIANDVDIGQDCIVDPGALVSFGVHLADVTRVPSSSRITMAKVDDDADVQIDERVVGKGGQGYLYDEDEDDDEQDEASSVVSKMIYNLADLNLSDSSISTLNSQVSDEVPTGDRGRSDSFATTVSEDDDVNQFHHDAAKGIFDALEQNVSSDVAQLELVGLRMSANASEHQVRLAVVAAFMKQICNLMDTKAMGASDAIRSVFGTYKGLVQRIMFDREKDKKDDQVDLLVAIQQDLVKREKGETIMLFTAKDLYDMEILEEEAYEQWWADERSSSDEEMRRVRQQSQQFVEWLANAEEEEDSEEEESEDE